MCIRFPRHRWPNSFSAIDDPVVPLERNLCGHPLAGLSWDRQFDEVLLELGWEKVPNWACLFVHRKTRVIFCQKMWMTSNGWKEAEYDHHVEEIEDKCGSDNPHHFLTVYTLDALNVNANRVKRSLNNVHRWLNHVFCAAAPENYRDGKTSRKNHGVVQRHGHAQKRLNGAVNWETSK